MPIARGAELKFIGANLDKVTAVVLPNNLTITTFTSKTPEPCYIHCPPGSDAGTGCPEDA